MSNVIQATIGHNQPPAPTLDLSPEEWNAWLRHTFEEATKRRDELVAEFHRFEGEYPLHKPVLNQPPPGIHKWNEDVQGKVGDLRDSITALLKNATNMHDKEKAPVLLAQRAIDGFLRQFREPLDAAMAVIRDRQTIFGRWQEDQQRRAAYAEAERLERAARTATKAAAGSLDPEDLERAAVANAELNAATQQANARPAELTRVVGEMGSRTSLRAAWTFVPEESDIMVLAQAVVAGKAPASYLAFNDTRIKLAIRVEKVRRVPGLTIREERVAR